MNQTRLNYRRYLNATRQKFLSTFFDDEIGYEEKRVNGFWLIKQLDIKTNEWNVAIFTPDAYLKRQSHNDRVKELLNARRNNASEDK